MNTKDTRIKVVFFLFSLVTLLLSITIKIMLNMTYEDSMTEALLEIASINVWLIFSFA